MANYLRTVLVQNRAEAADRTFQEDLPVNPLSHILITLRALTVAADVATTLADLYAMITAVAVRYRGQDIIRGSLRDLAVFNSVVCGWQPWGQLVPNGAAEELTLTVPICFGRRPYMIKECFPAVRRGDLTLELTIDVAVGNLNTMVLQIETVELLDENPENYIKYTTSRVVFPSTGQEVVRLPIGNPLAGVLLFGTTVPINATRTATWEQTRLRVDHVEALHAFANWDTLHGEIARRTGAPGLLLQEHAHRYNGAAAAFGDTLQQQRSVDLLENYAFIDLDPRMDGSYMLETAGRADVELVREAGTADTGRFLPVEYVSIRGAAQA